MAQRTSSESPSEQYSLAKILGIWALAAIPMGILGWIAFGLLAPDFECQDAYGDSEVTLDVDIQGGVGQINLEVV
jgi:hypothetical protein